MSIYSFSDTSLLREVVFRYAADRPPVGLLESAHGINSDQLDVVRRSMEAQGWQCVPVFADGKDYMQVSGFKTPGELLGYLYNYNFIQGEPHITPESGDDVRRTMGEWAHAIGLKGAGALNLVGDVALLASGITSGRAHEITGGALYTAGAAVLTRYANVKTEHHLRKVAENTAKFLQSQAGELPPHCGLFSILKEKREGFVPNLENFLYRYPSEVMLGAYTLGAAAMLQSGIKQGNPWGVAYGTSSLALKAASLLIPEKHISDEEKARAGPFGKFVHWVQEKPLRVFGFGSLVTDTLLGLSAYREFRNDPKQKGYVFKFVTTGTYMLADVLMAISNKNHANADGKFDTEEQRRLEALIAETISCQPKEMQEALVQQVSGYLAMQPEMQGKAGDFAEAIREQMAHLKHNPWTSRTNGSTPHEQARL